jgi:serine/threonine protein kinase
MSDPTSVGQYEVLGIASVRQGSTIFFARHKLTGLALGLKRFRVDDPVSSAALHRELVSLTGTFHPFTACLFETIDAGDSVYLAIDLPARGSLRDLVQQKGAMTEAHARLIVVQLISAIEYLHFQRQVIFRNVRPRNIRFDEHHCVRLGDFSFCDSLSSLLQRDSEEIVSNREEDLADLAYVAYTAPEILMDQPATAAADIWSLGVLLFELVTATMPFDTPHLGRLSQKILREHPTFPRTVSRLFCDLISRMLAKDPNQRITLENIKQHPWINEGDHFVLNFTGVEELRLRYDPSSGIVDPVILESVRALGLDVSDLPVQLLNGQNSDAASAYRQYVRMEMTRRLVDIVPGMLVRQPRPHGLLPRPERLSPDPLPRYGHRDIVMGVRPREVASVGREGFAGLRLRPPEMVRRQSRSPTPPGLPPERLISFGMIPH